MDIVNILAGPLIGAVIGYFTNYIAVKMLFRPWYPIKIGKFTMPFTPGIIPKRKAQMAKALGKAVGDNLLTTEDLEKVFLSEKVMNLVADEITNGLYGTSERASKSFKEHMITHVSMSAYEDGKERLALVVCDKIIKELEGMEIAALIAEEGKRAVKEKIGGTLLEMMISDDLIENMGMRVGKYVEEYISDHGQELVLPAIQRQLEELEAKHPKDLLESAEIQREQVRHMAMQIYGTIIRKKVQGIAGMFDVPAIVEEKVNAMDVQEMERLVLSVMKKELDSIVSLGAVIGFVIGCVNIFI